MTSIPQRQRSLATVLPAALFPAALFPAALFPAALLLNSCAQTTEDLAPDTGTPPTHDPAPLVTSGQTADANALLACQQARSSGSEDCRRSERALSDGDAAALGFDPADFLALLAGEHRAPVAWQVEGAPTGRGTELVLTIEPLGAVRFVDLEPPSGRSEIFTAGDRGGLYLSCGDRVLVDARLRMVSADGALNEQVEARVEADSGRYARTTVQLHGADIAGSLRASLGVPAGPDRPAATELTLVFGISELGSGLEGSLAIHAARAAGVVGAAPCNQIGTLALAPSCPLGAFPLGVDEALLGLSFPGALSQLNASSPATLEDTGAQLALQFEASPSPVCVSIDTPATLPSLLMFPGRARLEASDGRVGGSLDVQLAAQARGGTLQRVTARAEYLVPDPRGLTELAPSYAILQPLAWSEHELGGFEFLVQAEPMSSGGILRAIGGNLRCQSSRPCEDVCPGPGCSLTNAEKWAVRWGAPVGVELPLQTPP